MTTSLPISDIAIGERARKDMGDLQALAGSMATHGLLHPVVVNGAKILIAGHRRIEAARLLGWQEIPVTMIEVDDMLGAERDENDVRKDFTPSEAVAIGRLIEERERPRALERKRLGALNRHHGTDSATSIGEPRTVSKVAAAVGMSVQRFSQAKRVLAAAEAEPDKFGDLPAKMDETGNVYGTHRELERRRHGLPEEQKCRGLRKDKTAPFEIKTKRHRELAEGQKDRMVRSLSIVSGHCRGMEDLDVAMIFAVCSDEELSEWIGKAREAGRAFRHFAAKLERGLKHGN